MMTMMTRMMAITYDDADDDYDDDDVDGDVDVGDDDDGDDDGDDGDDDAPVCSDPAVCVFRPFSCNVFRLNASDACAKLAAQRVWTPTAEATPFS